MTVSAILEIIQGVLKFPDAVLALVRALKDTPEESRQKVLAAMQKEADSLAATGRPDWND